MAMQSEDNSRSSSEYYNNKSKGRKLRDRRGVTSISLIRSGMRHICAFSIQFPSSQWPRLSQLNQKLMNNMKSFTGQLAVLVSEWEEEGADGNW